MNRTSEHETNPDDDDLSGEWFQQGELMEDSDADAFEEKSGRGSRVGIVVAAISATALTLVIVFAGRV